jgi:hypothetical protein
VHDHQIFWDPIYFFRCEEIDTDNEFLRYRLAVRSHHTWQLVSRVLMNRAALHQFTVETATKLQVLFVVHDPTRVVYYGGKLQQGGSIDSNKMQAESPGSMEQQPTKNGSASEASALQEQRALAELGDDLEDDANEAVYAMIRQTH